VAAWTELATRVAEDLEHLGEYSLSEQEALNRREASTALAEYRRIFEKEQILLRRGDRAGALRLSDTTARVLTEQVRRNLDGSMGATRSRVIAAQAEATHLETGTWTAVLIALGAAVCLALFGAAIIARRMTRSLDLLSSATAEVAANAFREPIAVESSDEIGALARSFNSMASQLRQAEEAKREFFATISHELRSPLTSIRGAVDLLHGGDPGPLTEKQVRLTDSIGQSSERLLRLANQILEMSGLRAGCVELDWKPLDLARLVDRVVEELHPQAEEAGVALEHECCGSNFTYLGDEERLYQLVVNLGANAIRFSAAWRPRARTAHRREPGVRAPGRGHGRGHSRRGAAHYLRSLPTGAPRSGRHWPGLGDRRGCREGPRGSRNRGVARKRRQPLHRSPSALLSRSDRPPTEAAGGGRRC
jgi:signal transduction histidine kinase